MRILVVGAGAIGGYFGARLLQAGRDVTFLVRPKRAAQLKRTGLAIRSPHGDFDLPAPPTALAEDLSGPFDLVLLSCKAYDLEGAAESMAPAVGESTAILPVLNGMRHLDFLDARFGAGRALGGLCVISAGLDPDGRILHLNDLHALAFGERDGSRSARAEAVASALSGARFDARLSQSIVQEMWEKWMFIAALAGTTCLMRATVGDIVAAGAANVATTLLDECAAIAAREGFAPGAAALQFIRATLTAPGSRLTASMLRDVERGAPVEADHVIGDLLRRGDAATTERSALGLAYAQLRAYEARQARIRRETKPAP